MEAERKLIKFSSNVVSEESDVIFEDLASSMVESKKVKRLADLFLIALFLIFLTYITLHS
jgi:hypothetical protein